MANGHVNLRLLSLPVCIPMATDQDQFLASDEANPHEMLHRIRRRGNKSSGDFCVLFPYKIVVLFFCKNQKSRCICKHHALESESILKSDEKIWTLISKTWLQHLAFPPPPCIPSLSPPQCWRPFAGQPGFATHASRDQCTAAW